MQIPEGLILDPALLVYLVVELPGLGLLLDFLMKQILVGMDEGSR